MKIYNIDNVEEFFNVVNSCEGTVELISQDGDRLNLKSKLCQYIALSRMFHDDHVIDELELVAHNPDDVQKLLNYMVHG